MALGDPKVDPGQKARKHKSQPSLGAMETNQRQHETRSADQCLSARSNAVLPGFKIAISRVLAAARRNFLDGPQIR